MKFLVFSCLHFSSRSPLRRRDNYGELILNKLKWIIDYSNDMESTIICLGDILHRKWDISFKEVNALMDVIGSNQIYGIMGNHDCQATMSRQNTDNLAIGTLIKAGKFRLIQNGEQVDFLNGVYVTGENYHLDYEVPETYNREVKEARVHIHLTHGMLTEKPLPYNATHIKELELSCDYLFNGHSHSPFMDEERGIYNVGSVARISMDKNCLNKTPQVCLLDTELRQVDVVEVPIEEDVWVNEITRETLDSDEIEKFADSIKEMEIQDDEEMLKKILEGEDREVCEKTYSYLEE